MKIIFFLSILSFNLFALDYDAENGERIFKGQCSACHNNALEGMKAPILNSQEPKYLERSLRDFKNDVRQDHIARVMNNIAKRLTDSEIKDVSFYLSNYEICKLKFKIDTEDADFRETFLAGKKVATDKNCMHCHGSLHHGAPKLYGQKKSYLETTLKAYKKNKRPSQLMQRVVAQMSDEEIKNVSFYMNAMFLMRECGEHEEH